MKGGKVLAQPATGVQQWLHDLGQVRHVADEFADALLERGRTYNPDLETEVGQQPADLVLECDRFSCRSLRAVSSTVASGWGAS